MKQLKLGIIGTNFVSDWLAEAAASSPFAVSAVYSRRQETGDAFAEKHGIPAVFTEYEAFLQSGLDAVYVASPNAVHAGQSIAALEHGLHVLCEKIIASDTAEFDRMAEAARKNRRVLLEAMRPSFDLCTKRILEHLPRVGTLRRAVFDYCQYSSRYDRFKNGEILNAFNPALSNAAVMDIGVYPIHMAAKFFGRPKRILSMSTFLSNGFEGAGHVLLDYGDQKTEISYSKITDSVTPNLLMGENGTITFDKITMPRTLHFLPRGGEPEQIPFTPAENNMVFELAEFASLIERGEYDHPHLETSRITLEIIGEIRRQNGIVFPSDRRTEEDC